MKKYDVIGDIHGYAKELRQLLEKLGYSQDEDGIYKHPEPDRKAVFIGDYIDRGPENFETIRIVRGMVEAENAHAIMGNHDLNAGLFHTLHPETQKPLRPHRAGNIKGHRAFLDEHEQDRETGRQHIDWLKTLPICLEMDGLRFIHAVWDKPSLAYLRESGILASDNTIHLERWHEIMEEGTRGCDSMEILAKGVEYRLPEGVSFLDPDNNQRKKARLRWWGNHSKPGLRLHEALLDVPPTSSTDIPVPDDMRQRMKELQQTDGTIVFFGHYWQRGETPSIELPHAICIDQSVAKDGHLAAATVTVEEGKVIDITFTSVKSRPPRSRDTTSHMSL